MTARVITRAWRSTACSVCVSIIAAAANNIAMADEDNEQEQDAPEPPPRLFTLKEAETARRELEPFLVEAMEKLSVMRAEHRQLAESLKSTLSRILETGCLIKDLEVGLLDFPSLLNNEEVYLCWKLGEDRIRFYHRQDEGFSGRKPLDPRDPGSGDIVQ